MDCIIQKKKYIYYNNVNSDLFTLAALEVDVAITLATFGRGPQLPEPVGLSHLRQADVPEGPGGDHHVGLHAVHI